MTSTVSLLEDRVLYKGRFPLTRARVAIREANGAAYEIEHEVYRHGFAAAILLYDPDRRVVLLVKQFRMPPFLAEGTTEMLEVCAGMLDGDAPDVCARREAQEETGVEAREIRHAFDCYMSPGGVTERISCFTSSYTPHDRKHAGGGVDEDEHIEIVEMDFEAALRLIGDGGIRDAKTIALLYHARATGPVVTETGDEAFLEAGRKLFAGSCDFFLAAAKPSGLPEIGAPEIAFAGRSNVGKSSLVNALTGRNALARASHTPGRTRELIFFDLEKKLTLVDMPGYGYASVSKEMSSGWVTLVRDYLRGRPTLLRAFVLVDGRHGVKSSDEETFASLDATAVSYAVVLTKRDEVKAAAQEARVEATLAALRPHPAAYPQVFFTSARTGEGVPELRAHVARLLAERGGA